jgi:BASS family bile acid:Na+ symporter
MDIAALIGRLITASIFVTVLGYAIQTSIHDALFLFRQPRLLLRAVVSMSVIMPLVVGLMLAKFALSPVIVILLVALAVSPVPPVLPNKAFKSGGHRAYTMGLLTAISLLSIITVPAGLIVFERIFHQYPPVAPLRVGATILAGIIAPLLVGILIHHLSPDLGEGFGGIVVKLGLVCLVVGFLPVLVISLPAVWALVGNGSVLAIAAFVVVGLAVGHFLGGPDPEDRTVLAISTATRHPGIAIPIIASATGDAKQAAAAVILYLLVSALVSAPYLKLLSRSGRTPREVSPVQFHN